MGLLVITQKRIGAELIIGALLMAGAYIYLMNGLPCGDFALLVTGIATISLVWDKAGFDEVVKKPSKYFVKDVVGSYASCLVLVIGGALLLKSLHITLNGNPIETQLQGNIIVTFLRTLPALLGEEFLTVFLLLAIANRFFNLSKGKLLEIGIYAAIVLSSLIFGLLHSQTYNFNLAQCLLIAVVRIPMTAALVRSDTIWAGFATHVAYDWTLFLITLFVASH